MAAVPRAPNGFGSHRRLAPDACGMKPPERAETRDPVKIRGGMSMHREKTKAVQIGDRKIGGGNPILIQSMTNTKTQDVAATVAQILELEQAGCEIVRCTVPDMEAAQAISEIKKQIHIPLVADIHFDYRMAIAAMENGADKIRINPGNIGGRDNVKAVAEVAAGRGIPIRVGVNSGSLEKHLIEKYGGVTAEGIVESALDKVHMMEELGFDDLVISIKSSDVLMCVRAHELLAERTVYPLHVGITEAGTVQSGNIKSAIGLGLILNQGIGDTIRVSLTGDPVGKADPADTGAEKGRYRGGFLPYLRPDQDRSHRTGRKGGKAGGRLPSGYQGSRHGLRGERAGGSQGSPTGHSRGPGRGPVV